MDHHDPRRGPTIYYSVCSARLNDMDAYLVHSLSYSSLLRSLIHICSRFICSSCFHSCGLAGSD